MLACVTTHGLRLGSSVLRVHEPDIKAKSLCETFFLVHSFGGWEERVHPLGGQNKKNVLDFSPDHRKLFQKNVCFRVFYTFRGGGGKGGHWEITCITYCENCLGLQILS